MKQVASSLWCRRAQDNAYNSPRTGFFSFQHDLPYVPPPPWPRPPGSESSTPSSPPSSPASLPSASAAQRLSVPAEAAAPRGQPSPRGRPLSRWAQGLPSARGQQLLAPGQRPGPDAAARLADGGRRYVHRHQRDDRIVRCRSRTGVDRLFGGAVVPAVKAARYVEWWAHSRQHCYGSDSPLLRQPPPPASPSAVGRTPLAAS